jgi:hypothetical protein
MRAGQWLAIVFATREVPKRVFFRVLVDGNVPSSRQ